MPLDTKHLFLTSPELGNQFILILILTGRRAAMPCATGGRDHYRVLTYLKAS
jgi:hypothetical protein